MRVFEIVIALLLGGAALAALARRIGTPYPALVALAGAALALVPGTPTIVLDPSLALALFVAPVLLDAAFDASPRDLRANWRPVAGLAIGAVALTIVAVATVARMIVPGMAWSTAVALGAIVAPSDAAAATAVLRQVRPPHRLLVILEGESLFNDASALLVYRLAVGVAVGGMHLGWNVIPTVLLVTVGSIALGLILAPVLLSQTAKIRDVATAVIVQFCGTFGVWLLAERLHLSGILTTVTYAMVAGQRASAVVPARIRVPSYAVWEVAVFVLNVLAFILVGFQLKSIALRLDRPTLIEYAWVAAAVCAATIVARMVWVVGVATLSRWWCGRHPTAHRGAADAVALSPRASAVIAWCGMRGIVTLAAALALPAANDGVPAFPYRDLILFTAFAVVVGTLVVQGMTLRPMLLWLGVQPDDTVEREVLLARVETLRAAVAAMNEIANTDATALVRRRYEWRLRRAEEELAGAANGPISAAALRHVDDGVDAAGLRAAVAAERKRLSALRAEGTIGDAAFQRVEQELDWFELDLQQFMGTEDVR